MSWFRKLFKSESVAPVQSVPVALVHVEPLSEFVEDRGYMVMRKHAMVVGGFPLPPVGWFEAELRSSASEFDRDAVGVFLDGALYGWLSEHFSRLWKSRMPATVTVFCDGQHLKVFPAGQSWFLR